MKYKVGDKVRVKDLAWYEANKGEDGVYCDDGIFFINKMSLLCGKTVTINGVYKGSYTIVESKWGWQDWMFEDGVVEESIPTGNDPINPDHYKQGKVECIDAIESATTNLKGGEAVCTAQIIKYIWRWKAKNGLEDLDKVQWYLNRLVTMVSK